MSDLERTRMDLTGAADSLVDLLAITLTRSREAIDYALSRKDKGGAAFKLPWHTLAWHIASEMQARSDVKPSRSWDAQLQELLRACLEVGLKGPPIQRASPGRSRRVHATRDAGPWLDQEAAKTKK